MKFDLINLSALAALLPILLKVRQSTTLIIQSLIVFNVRVTFVSNVAQRWKRLIFSIILVKQNVSNDALSFDIYLYERIISSLHADCSFHIDELYISMFGNLLCEQDLQSFQSQKTLQISQIILHINVLSLCSLLYCDAHIFVGSGLKQGIISGYCLWPLQIYTPGYLVYTRFYILGSVCCALLLSPKTLLCRTHVISLNRGTPIQPQFRGKLKQIVLILIFLHDRINNYYFGFQLWISGFRNLFCSKSY